jgi:hypothetical protein
VFSTVSVSSSPVTCTLGLTKSRTAWIGQGRTSSSISPPKAQRSLSSSAVRGTVVEATEGAATGGDGGAADGATRVAAEAEAEARVSTQLSLWLSLL